MDAALGASDGLREREKERQVAVNAFLRDDLGGFDALPCARDFDEHAVAADACFFVKRDELAGLRDGASGVKGKTRIGFCAHTTGDDFQNLQAEVHEDMVHYIVHAFRAGEAAVFAISDGFVHEVRVFGLRCGREDERGIRGRVLRLVGLHGLEVAGVCDDLGELLELVELSGHVF